MSAPSTERQRLTAQRLIAIAQVLDLPSGNALSLAAAALLDPGRLPRESQFVLALLIDATIGREQS
jgi:hypothetical protein